MDNKDKEILDALQNDFRVTERPFQGLAEKCDVTEEEVLSRLNKLRDDKLIRYIGAFINTPAMGFKSQLASFHVDEKDISRVVEVVNSHPGVSHNYLRDHYYNLWFTVAVPPAYSLKKTMDILLSETGVEKYLILPSLKVYKLRFVLNLSHKQENQSEDIPDINVYDQENYSLTQQDENILTLIQNSLDIVAEPFKEVAEKLNIGLEVLFEKLNEFTDKKIIRRWGTVLSQVKLGYTHNAMIVWKVEDEEVDNIGERMAESQFISHCYRRPVFPDWPYQLFTMIHAQSQKDLSGLIEKIERENNILEYMSLSTVKEMKKKRLKYFTDEYDEWYKKYREEE